MKVLNVSNGKLCSSKRRTTISSTFKARYNLKDKISKVNTLKDLIEILKGKNLSKEERKEKDFLVKISAIVLGMKLVSLGITSSILLLTPMALQWRDGDNAFLKFLSFFSGTAQSPSARSNEMRLSRDKQDYSTRLFYFGLPALFATVLATLTRVSRLGLLASILITWLFKLGIAEIWNRAYKYNAKNDNTQAKQQTNNNI